MNPAPEAEASDPRWRLLYGLAGVGALLSAVFIPIQVAVFIVWPPPLDGTAADWFELFRDNRLVGLLDLDLLLIADSVFLVPIFLALYVLLRRDAESLMAVATALGFLGIVFFVASNPAFEMLSLSQRYAEATPRPIVRPTWPRGRPCWPRGRGRRSRRTTSSGPSPAS